MPVKITDLSALVASRLCHDLVSPVGAISNGLEIIAEEDDPEIIKQAVDLLNMSVRQAEYKLTFYRMAFGASASAAGDIASRDVAKAAANYLGEERVTFDWPGDVVPLSKTQTRVLANLILLGRDCLPRGGTLTAGMTDGRIEVLAKGQGCRIREEAGQVLAGDLENPMPHLAPAALLKELLQENRSDLIVKPQEESVYLAVNVS
jgi:histidine phosphotransferase ChpT